MDISQAAFLSVSGWENTEDGGGNMLVRGKEEEEDLSETYLQNSRIKLEYELIELCRTAANNKVIDNVDSFCARKYNEEAFFVLVSSIKYLVTH